ncbi:MAG: hypothetical protein HFJ43_01910 [Clostridia bacterium]|nr:hypothetical protein [Clostridia bacterium]
MNKKNKRPVRSKIHNIIIVLIVMIFILLITLGILIQMFSKNENNKTTEVVKRNEEYVRQEKIHLMDQEKFFNSYSGVVKEEKIITFITNYIYYLIDNKNNIENVEDINKVYINNKQKFENMGIISNNEYEKIVNTIKNMNTTKLELSYAEFDMETLIESSNNISIDLRIKFVDIDNVLKVKMDISKSDNTKNVIAFSIHE